MQAMKSNKAIFTEWLTDCPVNAIKTKSRTPAKMPPNASRLIGLLFLLTNSSDNIGKCLAYVLKKPKNNNTMYDCKGEILNNRSGFRSFSQIHFHEYYQKKRNDKNKYTEGKQQNITGVDTGLE